MHATDGIIDDEIIDISDEGITFVAGSHIPIYGTWSIEKIVGKWPTRCRIELVDPYDKVTYWIDFKTDKIEEFEYSWHVTIYDKDMRVGAFSASGGWKARVTWYSNFWIIENNCGEFNLLYDVGESSLWDHFTAPIHLTWGGVPIAEWGKFSFALPCLLLLSSPIWAIALFIVTVRYWYGSVRLGLHELRKAPVKLFRKKKKNGGKIK